MEYNFRGFDAIGDKGWVYDGDLVHNKKVTETGLVDRVMVGGYEVVPESVGICTDLKDRKGRDIYVGDIISIWDKEYDMYQNCEVLFRYGVIGVENHFEHLTPLSFFLHIYNGKQLESEEYEIEVIGTVFENKELLSNEK